MRNIKRYIIAGVMVAFAGAIVLGAYARIWEYRQPEQLIENARVMSIEPYRAHNDLHWSARGYRIRVYGKDAAIDFPLKNWDDTVEVGDSVDLVVRENFPLCGSELDGISLDDHK